MRRFQVSSFRLKVSGMVAGDLTFKIVMGAAVPFRSTKEALRYAQTGTSKAYAYRVNEIEVASGTFGGKNALAANPAGTTSICADILLQGALDVNGAIY